MGAHRRFGILTGLAAVCWALALALVLVAAATGLFMVLLGASETLTPSPTGERDARLGLGVLLASAVGAVALGLLTLVLDAVVTVLSLRRLHGDAHGRAVPVLSLVAVGLSMVLPLLLGGLALGAGALELSHLAAALWWMLLGTVFALAPCARLAQLLGGLVTAVTASRGAGVGPLP